MLLLRNKNILTISKKKYKANTFMINKQFITVRKKANFSDLEWISVFQSLVNIIHHE